MYCTLCLQLKECKELSEDARRALEEGKNYIYAIEASSEVVDAGGPVVGPQLRHDCLCIRAAAFLKVFFASFTLSGFSYLNAQVRIDHKSKIVDRILFSLGLQRQWKNDVHIAIRDCNEARAINPNSVKAHHLMAEALAQVSGQVEVLKFKFLISRRESSRSRSVVEVPSLGPQKDSNMGLLQLQKPKEALEFALRAHQLDPKDSGLNDHVAHLRAKLQEGQYFSGVCVLTFAQHTNLFRLQLRRRKIIEEVMSQNQKGGQEDDL